MKRGAKRIRRLAALSAAAASTLTVMTASPAAADEHLYMWDKLDASVSSGSIIAQLWMDSETTGRYARITFTDNDSEDPCTFGYMEWRHVNGHSYLDQGKQCSGSSTPPYGVRNQNYYVWVRPCIWVGQYAFRCGEKVDI